jgi:hypothetical protein
LVLVFQAADEARHQSKDPNGVRHAQSFQLN